ncbi:hypothetical protein C8J57DRAFT_1729041 [Mycena rebaudengoi]|nr:hypothetical protein C8J57DRAFT_1729041 [Mycena rebaudengoi]
MTRSEGLFRNLAFGVMVVTFGPQVLLAEALNLNKCADVEKEICPPEDVPDIILQEKRTPESENKFADRPKESCAPEDAHIVRSTPDVGEAPPPYRFTTGAAPAAEKASIINADILLDVTGMHTYEDFNLPGAAIPGAPISPWDDGDEGSDWDASDEDMADGSLADLVNPWAESGSTHQVPVPLPERADPVVNLSDGSARDRSPVDPDGISSFPKTAPCEPTLAAGGDSSPVTPDAMAETAPSELALGSVGDRSTRVASTDSLVPGEASPDSAHIMLLEATGPGGPPGKASTAASGDNHPSISLGAGGPTPKDPPNTKTFPWDEFWSDTKLVFGCAVALGALGYYVADRVAARNNRVTDKNMRGGEAYYGAPNTFSNSDKLKADLGEEYNGDDRRPLLATEIDGKVSYHSSSNTLTNETGPTIQIRDVFNDGKLSNISVDGMTRVGPKAFERYTTKDGTPVSDAKVLRNMELQYLPFIPDKFAEALVSPLWWSSMNIIVSMFLSYYIKNKHEKSSQSWTELGLETLLQALLRSLLEWGLTVGLTALGTPPPLSRLATSLVQASFTFGWKYKGYAWSWVKSWFPW